ncbi:MAG TPA: hypothetical protein VN238_10670 [Solirubrobacteraceae bacterium]|nr:hypothetical protein [Solirubrobacteraceae bacterium]
MAEPPAHLNIKLEGPLVEQHRLPMSELERLTKLIRGTLRSIALVLTDEGAGRQSGRVKRFIETSVDLDVVGAPRAGSFVLDLEVAPTRAGAQEGLDIYAGPPLGERAVRALVTGLETLTDATEQLPEGFDRGVLQSIEGFRTTLSRDVESITFSTSGTLGAPARTKLTSARVGIVHDLIRRPFRSHAAAEGTLRMVDDRSLECRLERSPLPSVICVLEDKDRDAAWRAGQGRQLVRVVGEGEFFPGEAHPRKLWASSVRVVSEALPFDPELFWSHRSLDELAEEQEVRAFAPRSLDDDWRDDDEAAALIAALADG